MIEKINFSFGKNWQQYLTEVQESDFEDSKSDILYWLDEKDIVGKSVIDIGCGSGMSSMAFYEIGAQSVLSFDFDEHSVKATKTLWKKSGKPENWTILLGSVLELDKIIKQDEKFDLVYSWGVLHHTGAMNEAIMNCLKIIKPNGKLWITLYQKGPKYLKHLRTKEKYNSSSALGRKIMIYNIIAKMMILKIIKFENPFNWNEKRVRGMNAYYDIIDWLGGLPYEVASEDEVVSMCLKSNLVLERIKISPEGGCSNYVFKLSSK